MKKITLFTLILGVFYSASSVFSYSLNSYTGMAVEKTLIASGVFTAINNPRAYTGDITFTYGLNPDFDITVNNGGISEENEGKYSNFFFMPRYQVASNHIFGVIFKYDSLSENPYILSPQYHTIIENENSPFVFVFNAGININTKETKENLTANALIAPVYKIIPDKVHFFLEIDPSYQFSGESKGSTLDLYPGFWFGIMDAKYQISVSAIIKKVFSPDNDKTQYGIGLFLSMTFE